jgi:hypothetical protein
MEKMMPELRRQRRVLRISLCLKHLPPVMFLASASLTVYAADNPCAGHGDSPGGISLRLSLRDGQTTFREGEIIALTAEYSAAAQKRYTVNNRSYDRSGRLNGEEVFCIDPDTSTDPLFSYFNSARGFMMGGIFSAEDPGREPLVVNLELNEWHSLPPGSYRLSVIGNRATAYGKDEPMGLGDTSIPLRSNAVEFQVVPADPSWQAGQLAEAVTTLDSSTAGDDDRKHAARILRFLDSEASTRELAHRYCSGKDSFTWEMKFGLYGSPHRQVAIDAMKAELTDPEHPVSSEFVDTLVTLEMQSEPRFEFPPYDDKNPEPFHRAQAAYDAEYERRVAAYMTKAATAVDAKPADARALSASELLQANLHVSPAERERWRQMLVVSFDTLPAAKLNELLEYRWQDIGGPEWLPVLKSIVAGPPNPSRRIDYPNRSVALRRVYQLSPDEGRPLILKEIASPKGDIGIDVLGILPDRELPQFDGPTLARIRQNPSDVDYNLIDRYATARILPDIKSIYESQSGKWACIPQDAMLRYFLRIDPAYSASAVSAALSSRTDTGCYRDTLTQLKALVQVSRVQAVAIATLDDPSIEVARDAAVALQHYGSPEAEAALWKRLAKLHDKWKDNPAGLHPRAGRIVMAEDSGLEDALVNALLAGEGWFADESLIHRLKDLSSEEMQPRLDEALKALSEKQFQLSLQWWPEDDMAFELGWYQGTGLTAFEEKLRQFPAGSHFRMITTHAEQEAHAAEFTRLQNAAASNGQVFDIEVPR